MGLLLGAVLTQLLLPMPQSLNRLGHVVGYVIGSLWFVAGALAQIADVAREKRLANLGKTHSKEQSQTGLLERGRARIDPEL